MVPKPKYPQITKEFLEKEFAAGKSAGQIEREQNVPTGTVQNYCQRHGVKNPNSKYAPKKRPVEEPKAMWKATAESYKNELHREIAESKRKDTEIVRLQDELAEERRGHDEALRLLNETKARLQNQNTVKEPDMVNLPPHYINGGMEVIDIMKAKMTPEQFEGYLVGQVWKYTFRYRHKNGVEDLKKARWYLNRLIEEVERG